MQKPHDLPESHLGSIPRPKFARIAGVGSVSGTVRVFPSCLAIPHPGRIDVGPRTGTTTAPCGWVEVVGAGVRVMVTVLVMRMVVAR